MGPLHAGWALKGGWEGVIFFKEKRSVSERRQRTTLFYFILFFFISIFLYIYICGLLHSLSWTTYSEYARKSISSHRLEGLCIDMYILSCTALRLGRFQRRVQQTSAWASAIPCSSRRKGGPAPCASDRPCPCPYQWGHGAGLHAAGATRPPGWPAGRLWWTWAPPSAVPSGSACILAAAAGTNIDGLSIPACSTMGLLNKY